MNKQSRSMPLRTGTHALLEEAAYCILMASLNQIRSRADKSDVLSKRQEKLRQSREVYKASGVADPGVRSGDPRTGDQSGQPDQLTGRPCPASSHTIDTGWPFGYPSDPSDQPTTDLALSEFVMEELSRKRHR